MNPARDDRPTESQPVLPPACTACGTVLPAEATFCPGCGRRIKPVKGGESSVGPRRTGFLPRPEPKDKLNDLQWVQQEVPARYQVIRLLGKGGMGVVYQCTDTNMDRTVAVKLMSDRYHADPKAERRFLREARAQAIINHPNVATVLNVGVSPQGRPFLVMEFLEGRDLRQIIREFPTGLPVTRVCDLVEQACDGLAEAHAAGVVHRDMKPSNLLVVKDHRGLERVKILDLGLAKIIGGATDLRTITVETAGILIGTPAYMSPEQVAGQSVDARADLYALGVVLYEMLTGRLPFESETVEGWLYQHLNTKPGLPSQIRPELLLYPELDSIVLWSLSKAPHERPRTARDLAVALRSAKAKAARNIGQVTETPSSQAVAQAQPVGAALESSAGGYPSSASKVAPSALLRRTAAEAPPAEAGGHRSPDPALLRRQRYLELSQAADAAAQERKWDVAIEHWQNALKYAEDRETVNSQIESLQREISFEKVLASASVHAAAGDWARAEEALAGAGALRPADPRVQQAQARLPAKLTEAWLEGARSRAGAFPDGTPRQDLLRRLAIARGRMGDIQGAIRVLQDAFKDQEHRIIGFSKASVEAIQAGNREGLRPYLDRALEAVGALDDVRARGRASLELGRALTAYGDLDAAGEAFDLSRASFLESTPALAPPSDASSRAMRRGTRILQRGGKEQLLAAVAEAQAEAGLTEQGLSTAHLIDDPWTRSQTFAHLAQTLAKLGHTVEAERVAGQITFSLPKAQALRHVAVSRVYRGDMETAEQMVAQIPSPEERAPVQAFLAAAWSRRADPEKAGAYAKDALATALEVPGTPARVSTLIASAEPLVNIGALPLAAPFFQAAGRLIDGTEDPAERIRNLLRVAQLREKARLAGTVLGGAPAPTTSAPEIHELLRRALSSLRLLQTQAPREECLELLAAALAGAGSADLAVDLLAQCRNEMERALVFVNLALGMI